MLWLRLIEEILDLDIVQNDVCSKHNGDKTLVDFLTVGKLRFIAEVVGNEVSLVFREYGAEAIKVSKGGKVRSISIHGQEQKIIKRMNKIVRKMKMFLSFDEIKSDELTANHERKVVWS